MACSGSNGEQPTLEDLGERSGYNAGRSLNSSVRVHNGLVGLGRVHLELLERHCSPSSQHVVHQGTYGHRRFRRDPHESRNECDYDGDRTRSGSLCHV